MEILWWIWSPGRAQDTSGVKGDHIEAVHEIILGTMGLDLDPFQLTGGGLC